MKTSEFNANSQLSGMAAERAKWAAILAKPANNPTSEFFADGSNWAAILDLTIEYHRIVSKSN